jgi:GT2 family glycosyltransferase
MADFKNKLAFVVPTKDRPEELRRLLDSLERQSVPPVDVVIVDGGSVPDVRLAECFPRLPLRIIDGRPPSATRQRNLGIRSVDPAATLIGVVDDDTALSPEACERMLAFWDSAGPCVGGAAFNILNHPPLAAAWFKRTALAKRLGLYSRRPGSVSASGFQVMMTGLTADAEVEWLPSGASVWRRSIFDEFQFDEWFEGYSYLEDLDFSYRVGKSYRLYLAAGAGIYHDPSPRGRMSGFRFGRREVANRLYFVRKHPELSVGKCYLALWIKAGLNLLQGVRRFEGSSIQRSVGNIFEILRPVG